MKKSVFKWVENEQEVEALLIFAGMRPNGLQFHYLMILKGDIDKEKWVGQSKDVNAKKNLDTFLENNNISKNNPATMERIRELSLAHKELIVVFGEFSYVDLMIAADILAIKMASFPEVDFADNVDAEIQRFESSSWKNSPVLNQLYIIKCRSLINAKCYSLAYKMSIVVKSMREKICADKLDQIHLEQWGHSTFTVAPRKEPVSFLSPLNPEGCSHRSDHHPALHAFKTAQQRGLRPEYLPCVPLLFLQDLIQ